MLVACCAYQVEGRSQRVEEAFALRVLGIVRVDVSHDADEHEDVEGDEQEGEYEQCPPVILHDDDRREFCVIKYSLWEEEEEDMS